MATAIAVVVFGSVTAFAQSAAMVDSQLDNRQFAAGGSQSPSAREPAIGHAWQVVAVVGQAHVLVDDGQSIRWTPVQPGQELPGNSQIETGVGSQVLLFNGSDAITILADTQLALSATEADAERVEIYQNSGTAEYQVMDRSQDLSLSGFFNTVGQFFSGGGAPGDRFEVRAPFLTTVVKGTAFTVTVRRDSTIVAVSDGIVEVTDPRSGDGADLVAGQQAMAGANSAAGVQLEHGVSPALDQRAKLPPRAGSNSRLDGDRNDGDDRSSTADLGDGSQSGSGGSGDVDEAIGDGEVAGSYGGFDSGVGGVVSGVESAGTGGVETANASASASASVTGDSGASGGDTSSGGTGTESASSSSESAATAGDTGGTETAGGGWGGGGFGGGGSITISGSGERGSFTTTISRDGISTTVGDPSESGERSLTISRSGDSGSSTTTIDSDGINTTGSGAGGEAGGSGSDTGTATGGDSGAGGAE